MANHRRGDLAFQGALRSGEPPSQDAGRAVDPPGGEGGRLHLRPVPQRPTRPAATPLRLTLDLTAVCGDIDPGAPSMYSRLSIPLTERSRGTLFVRIMRWGSTILKSAVIRCEQLHINRLRATGPLDRLA